MHSMLISPKMFKEPLYLWLHFLCIFAISERDLDQEKGREMGIFYSHTDSTYIISAPSGKIKATVTDSGKVASNWINNILRNHRHRLDRLIVGLDIEWRPNTFPGIYGENPVALLQLCVGRRCLLFQLIHCDYIPDELDDFLLDDRFRFFGVEIEKDLEKLKRDCELEVANGCDLRDFAVMKMGRKEMRELGLKRLAEFMGVPMEKPKMVARSDWAVSDLSGEQIEYAAVDAFASFEIARRLDVGHSSTLYWFLSILFLVLSIYLYCKV